MDADRFDAVIRGLVAPNSRRTLLGVSAGGLAGSLLGYFEPLAGKRKKKCKKCGPCKKCQKGKCKPKQPKGGGCIPGCGGCPSGSICKEGVCVFCASGESACGEACVNLATDAANCGGCGNACPSGECLNGACTCNSEFACPNGCQCYATATAGGACGGAATSRPCDNYTCGLGEVCQAWHLLCTTPCVG